MGGIGVLKERKCLGLIFESSPSKKEDVRCESVC